MNITRKEAKEWLPIILAYAEGKTIQRFKNGIEWDDLDGDIDFGLPKEFYRVKPKPKYRPFKTQEECWNEMHKHPDFGWVKEKASEMIYNISGISELSIVILEDINSFKEAFDIYQFKDGAPFGIKE